MLDICQGYINDENENFLKLLIHNNRLNLLTAIAKLFEAYKAEDEGYIDVEVISAYSLSKEAKHDLTTTLEKTLGKKTHMNVTVDKSLIGGVLVRAGDKVIDGSIRGRLQQLAKRL
jgi:F-type H+-transporting ATPase subunit delta